MPGCVPQTENVAGNNTDKTPGGKGWAGEWDRVTHDKSPRVGANGRIPHIDGLCLQGGSGYHKAE